MAIAIFYKSESCDNILFAFDSDTSAEEIKETLEEELECHGSLCQYEIDFSGLDRARSKEISEIAQNIYNNS